jgi:glutaredoxin-like protein
MPVLDEQIIGKVTEIFRNNLIDDVELIVFTQEFECAFCKQARELVQQLSTISDKIKYHAYDFQRDSGLANEYLVDKIPATIMTGKKKYGIRFYGVPAGYEFQSFIDDIVDVSHNASRLSESVKNRIRTVSTPVHIQVFTSPTCPYCYKAVRTAHQFAIENEVIKADMVNAIEFPHLVNKYAVMGVPKVVINETQQFAGAVSEDQFADQIMTAIKTSPDRIYV